MIIERVVLLMAGTVILASLALAHWHNPAWMILTAFVGANLFFSGLTRFCPMVLILRKFGLKHGSPFVKPQA